VILHEVGDILVYEGKNYKAMPSIIAGRCFGCSLIPSGGKDCADRNELAACESDSPVFVLDDPEAIAAYVIRRLEQAG
jgi:hypothetical protein